MFLRGLWASGLCLRAAGIVPELWTCASLAPGLEPFEGFGPFGFVLFFWLSLSLRVWGWLRGWGLLGKVLLVLC